MATMDELVKQVQDLENATTDLLDATNVSKQTLDEAVDSASGSAQSAGTDAGTATEQRNQAVVARNEAVAAKDDAEAIVHEGEGSTTPGGGKYPVAYADGQIDSGWLPLLQAMYPYSGVIGSVDKGDLFDFYRDGLNPSWSNIFRLKAGNKFNINGRFIPITALKHIIFPEAESTAERAVAFDDIFLDWNGNVVQHRSITPHRTATGYDSDAIATEHGYTKVQNGLYRTSDRATYLLLLGRVARRNQGAYHPLWNPEGAGRVFTTASGSTSPANWYGSSAKPLNSTLDAFSFGSTGDTGNTHTLWGTINRGATYVGNPDDKYYDAIYAEDFTPLYYSAKNVIDRQALLFDSFNRAVAGETFMGAEALVDSNVYERTRIYGYNNNTNIVYYTAALGIKGLAIGTKATVRYDGNLYFGTVSEIVSTYFKVTFFPNDLPAIPNGSQDDSVINLYLPGFSARPQFLAVDIIGSLDAMPQEWLDNGLPGNWLAVGEEGEDLIPDGTEKHYKLSRKALVLHPSRNDIFLK